MTGYERDIQDLIDLGLDESRLRTHSIDEIAMALCAVQESGNDADCIEAHGDDGAAILYAESALGW